MSIIARSTGNARKREKTMIMNNNNKYVISGCPGRNGRSGKS